MCQNRKIQKLAKNLQLMQDRPPRGWSQAKYHDDVAH